MLTTYISDIVAGMFGGAATILIWRAISSKRDSGSQVIEVPKKLWKQKKPPKYGAVYTRRDEEIWADQNPKMRLEKKLDDIS